MRTPSKCRGKPRGIEAGLCGSCGRHDAKATGYVLVPFFRERYLLGHDILTCDDRLPQDTQEPVSASSLTEHPIKGCNRWGHVLGALVVAVASVLSVAPSHAACVWADPGANPYTGDKAAAVRKLDGIPAGTRERLAELVAARAGRHVVVTRDQIDGGQLEGLRDMNFGSGRICPGPVDRSMWPINHQEGAMVFQEGRYAVLWFSRCGNIAWAIDPDALPSPAQIKDGIGSAGDTAVRNVSEPGSLAVIGVALIAVWFAMRKAR